MTDIYYDTEFLEDGRTIELISLGMIREDMTTLYVINRDFDLGKLLANDWLMENVVPHLPIGREKDGMLHWDESHEDYDLVVPRHTIRTLVRQMVLKVPAPRLWADYGDYDHVVLAQLFGRMIDLPDGFPMFTSDVQQTAADLGSPKLQGLQPEGAEHHALADAKKCRWRHLQLRGFAESVVRESIEAGRRG
jgi:hypothetical protein